MSRFQASEIDDAILSASEKEHAHLDMPFQKRNLKILLGIMMVFLLVFAARLVYLGVIRGEYYAGISTGNVLRTIPIEAPRGKIFDRKGTQLVYNVPSIDLIFTVTDDIGQRSVEEYEPLADIMSISRDEIARALENAQSTSYSYIVIKGNLTQDEVLRFSEQEDTFPGIELQKSVAREYRESTIFSHIIGYESALTREDVEKYPDYLLTDSVGRQGVERYYEEMLRGEHGARRVEVDALGVTRREISSEPPKAGHDLILSIDAELQTTLYDVMREELDKNDLQRAAGVALDPNTGQILALVSLPSYDNNIFSQRNNKLYSLIAQNPDQPLFNRVISGEYPPASTIKPMIAAMALEEGVVNANTSIESRGGISVGDTFFGDWKVHGYTDLRRAIAVSSDVYFYSIGGGYGGVRGLGMNTMAEYEKRFGFSSATGIDLPGESPGFVPTTEWKEEALGERWYIGNTYHASIGQGYMEATPLQVAVATAAIVNDGIRYTPSVVSYIRDAEGDILDRVEPKGFDIGISSEALRVVREGMRETVTEGTALALNDLSVEVAGKTGTAQYGPEDKTHGWFVSYAPYENPEILLVVLVESQDLDGYHAVPITKKVYEAYFPQE